MVDGVRDCDGKRDEGDDAVISRDHTEALATVIRDGLLKISYSEKQILRNSRNSIFPNLKEIQKR